MKQIVLCLIGILLASFVSAQKINHPSLLYTPSTHSAGKTTYAE